MKSYFIDSIDVKLHVLADDAIDGKETILFLHGYPDSSSSWSKQFEYFKDKYRVAAFDLRGIKNSFQQNIPSNFDMQTLMEDLDNVIEFLVGRNGKLHLVGHDWGSVISWCYISDPTNLKKYLPLPPLAVRIQNYFIIMYLVNYSVGILKKWRNLSTKSQSLGIYFYSKFPLCRN